MPKCSKCDSFVANPRTPFVTCDKCKKSFHRSCAKRYIKQASARSCCIQNLFDNIDVINCTPQSKIKRSQIISPLVRNQLKLAEACGGDLEEEIISPTGIPVPMQAPTQPSILSQPRTITMSLPTANLLTMANSNQLPINQQAQIQTTFSANEMQLPSDWDAVGGDERQRRMMKEILASRATENYVSNKVTELTSIVGDHAKYISQLHERYSRLEKENDDLKRLMTSNAQKAEVKISGIPLSVALPEVQIAQIVMKHLGLESMCSLILSARKIVYKPRENQDQRAYDTQAIVVQFASTQTRDHVVYTAKRHGELVSDVIFPDSTETKSKVFVNEFFSQYTNSLLQRTKEIAKSMGYKFTWVRNGVIYSRRDENAPPIAIMTDSDLDKLN